MNEYTIIDNLIIDGALSSVNVKMDSRTVNAGDIFIAAKGVVNDGHDHILDVLKKNPSLIICEHSPDNLKQSDADRILKVGNSIDVMGYIARGIYNDPSSKLEAYGVTGTNGKTTTVFLINDILTKAKRKCGFISTVFTKTDQYCSKKSNMTTPGVFDVYNLLDQMVIKGNDVAIIEISSHALNQERVWGVNLNAAVFTNITPEHMDYHKNMDAYFSDKAKILNLLQEDGRAILNVDDPFITKLVAKNHSFKCVTFGIDNDADISANDIRMSTSGTKFVLKLRKNISVDVETSLIGRHNVYNILAAVGAVIDGEVSLDSILSAIKHAKAPPGRLEPVISNDPFSIFVDYAHTPNALENVLSCLKQLTKRDLICVFGCGGDRDRTKRPVMGKIAADLCDKIIVTSDNPRSELPMNIISEIEKGIPDTNTYSVIEDRETAIQEAIKIAHPDDIIIIAGKGHEDYQILREKTIHFDDKEVALNALKKS